MLCPYTLKYHGTIGDKQSGKTTKALEKPCQVSAINSADKRRGMMIERLLFPGFFFCPCRRLEAVFRAAMGIACAPHLFLIRLLFWLPWSSFSSLCSSVNVPQKSHRCAKR